MNRLILTASAALVAVTTIPAASAQTIRDRQYHQQDRIERGYQRGDLNNREYRRLSHQQASIEHQRERARRSGYGMTRHERERIAERQARANDRIYRERRDRQGRF